MIEAWTIDASAWSSAPSAAAAPGANPTWPPQPAYRSPRSSSWSAVTSTRCPSERSEEIFLALEARGDLDVRWRGGSLDRVVDERHADVAAVSVRSLTNFGWDHAVEVTYAIFGERGSLDVLCSIDRPPRRS